MRIMKYVQVHLPIFLVEEPGVSSEGTQRHLTPSGESEYSPDYSEMGKSLVINGSSHEFRSLEVVCGKAGLVTALRAVSPSSTEGYGDRRSLEAYGPADRVPASHGT